MNLSLKQLKVFLGIAGSASFTRTAQSMHLSQAALSAMIREIESQLQCRLLDRTTRTVVLTEAGRKFLPTARRIVEEFERAAAELRELGRQKEGSLVLGCTPMIAASLMPQVLARFAADQPAARIELVDRPPAELHQMVENGDLDAAFGIFFEQLAGIERVPLFPVHLVMVSAVSQPRQVAAPGPDDANWHVLEGVALIALPEDNPLQRLIEANLAQHNVRPAKRIVVTHMQTAIALAHARLGITVAPSFCEHVCQHYQVLMERMRPAVEFSFYRIMRAGREAHAMLGQLSSVFTDAAQRLPQ